MKNTRIRVTPVLSIIAVGILSMLAIMLTGGCGRSSNSTISSAPSKEVIVGVENTEQALVYFRSNGFQVRQVIRPIRAIAITGDVTVLHHDWVRYVADDPPDAVTIQDGVVAEDILDYGVDNINAEVVWGGAEDATNVLPGEGGVGIKLGIIDTGIHCTHEDLTPDCNFGANFVNPPFQGDDFGHGTHVAGLAAARDNSVGTIGTAPKASLYSIKVLNSSGSGSWSAVAAGIVWSADNGIHVVNMSLGGSSFNQAVADAVTYAHSKGVLIVSAAGNSGGCATCDTVLFPARYPESMAIAAVNSIDTRATFSSTGPDVDVAAPGVSNLAPVPTGSCVLCDPTGYKRLSGTSMATPHTAGVGVLLMSKGLSNVAARSRLRNTSIDLSPVGFDWLTGCGRIDAKRAVDNTGADCSGGPPTPPTPTPTPPTPCKATFTGSVHHKDPVNPPHVFRASSLCAGTIGFTLSWSNQHKDLWLMVEDPNKARFISDCCFPEHLSIPAVLGDWKIFVATKTAGKIDYTVTVSNP